MTPVWLVIFTRSPLSVYNIAFPMFHFLVMIERARATLFAHQYERINSKFAVFSAIFVVNNVTMFLEKKQILNLYKINYQ